MEAQGLGALGEGGQPHFGPSAQPRLWPSVTSVEHEGHEDRPDSGTWEQRQRQRRVTSKGLTRWPLRPAVFRILRFQVITEQTIFILNEVTQARRSIPTAEQACSVALKVMHTVYVHGFETGLC